MMKLIERARLERGEECVIVHVSSWLKLEVSSRGSVRLWIFDDCLTVELQVEAESADGAIGRIPERETRMLGNGLDYAYARREKDA